MLLIKVCQYKMDKAMDIKNFNQLVYDQMKIDRSTWRQAVSHLCFVFDCTEQELRDEFSGSRTIHLNKGRPKYKRTNKALKYKDMASMQFYIRKR